MSDNNNSQPTEDKPQPPKTIGKPIKTEFISPRQQPTAEKPSDTNTN
ncbi:hypothetical protein [Nostoc sp.]